MAGSIRAIQYGCGPVGCAVARLALQRNNIELVGAVDVARDKIGLDLGELLGMGRTLGIVVTDSENDLFGAARANMVFHQTGSSLKSVAPQLKRLVEFGVNIVSTTEELAYPYFGQRDLASEIDAAAKANGVTVLGTGVNPGFTMDSWPLFMTGVCQDVTKIKSVRIQNAMTRRLPFQKKIGAGCSSQEFQELVDAGTLRHVGIMESIAMIAAGLGWKLDDVSESIEPIIAQERVSSEYITVEPGQASGVRQVGHGRTGKKNVITLEFEASLGAPESFDAVYIEGTPNLEVTIKGGTHGDIATAAMVVNAAPRLLDAPPGLATMKDLPMVTFSTGESSL